MNRLSRFLGFLILALALLSFPVSAQVAQLNVNVTGYTLTSDPCQDVTKVKVSLPIAITTATTTQLIPASVGKINYLCNLTVSMSGTAPTLQLAWGDNTVPTNSTIASAATGGTLLHNTIYYYRVTGTNAIGETTASSETSQATGASPTPDTYTLSVTATGFVGATACNVYGRTTGAELLLGAGTLTSGTCTYLDTGVTPAGALPGANTAGATLTGAFTPSTGSILKLDGSGVQFASKTSTILSAITGGSSTPTYNGYLTYVAQ
jgi:hypothetical protein